MSEQSFRQPEQRAMRQRPPSVSQNAYDAKESTESLTTGTMNHPQDLT